MTSYARQGAYGGGIHDGIDIAAPYGTRINWPLPPSRVRTGYEAGGYGYYTVGYSGPYEVLFGHEAQIGNTGYAGIIDSTGYSTGNHTHLRVKLNGVTIDPIPWLNSIGGKVSTTQFSWEELLKDERVANLRNKVIEARNHNITARYLLYAARKPTAEESAGALNLEVDQLTKNLVNSNDYVSLWKSVGLSDADIKARQKAQDPFLPAFYESRKNLVAADPKLVDKINKARSELEKVLAELQK